MKVYILTMSASDKTNRISRIFTDNAYRVRENARAKLGELAATYNELEGHTLIWQTLDVVKYKVLTDREPYELVMAIEPLELV